MPHINYFIAESYISHWTIEDALRELYQNFIDYGEFTIDVHDVLDIASDIPEKLEINKNTEVVKFNNDFEPISADFLIIGVSNKSKDKLGKYGEGLKMAALVILRNGYSFNIYAPNFTATFYLAKNDDSEIKTLNVVYELYKDDTIENRKGFTVGISLPKGTYKNYSDNIIISEDIIHTREGYGDIVDKETGNIYVGTLFVCNLKGLKFAYNFPPNKISLDRDRKVPSNWDVKWNIGKIQETYEDFEFIGKSADAEHINIPNQHIPNYIPKIVGNEIQFAFPVANEEGETKLVTVSDNYNNQLKHSSFFSKVVEKLKKYLLTRLGVNDAAKAFRAKYCYNDDSKLAFDDLMKRVGIDINESKDKEDDMLF